MEFLMKQGVTKEEYKVSQMGKNQKKAYKASGMDIDEFEKLYKAKKTVTDTDGTLTSTMKYISGGATNYKQANAIAGGTLSERSYQKRPKSVQPWIEAKRYNEDCQRRRYRWVISTTRQQS